MTDTDINDARLENIPVDKVTRNPENPRLMFRQKELDELQESIRTFGIQVPVAVYKKGREFVLLDGERRWRCALKLNLPSIPAIIRDPPGQLDNLLLMFNIHALREQWDLLTIALKLPTVIDLLTEKHPDGKSPTEADLSTHTGLTRSVIRRCRLLVDLPDKYKGLLLEELKKPKAKQTISEDFFIEMERSLKTVQRAMPEVISDINRARDSLIKKYRTEIIPNLVDLRKLPKIARASQVGANAKRARAAIQKLIESETYSIEDAWSTVSEAYAEKDIVSRIESLLGKLEAVRDAEIDEDVREKLGELVRIATSILEGDA